MMDDNANLHNGCQNFEDKRKIAVGYYAGEVCRPDRATKNSGDVGFSNKQNDQDLGFASRPQPVESAQACVCQHSNTTILCKVCGQLMEGRIMKCPVHPKVFQLMGYSHCPRCHNSRLVQCGLPALTNSSTPSTPR